MSWRVVCVAAAFWTASGAIPGLFDPTGTFELFDDEPPASDRLVAIYRGARGQSLLFGIGYLIAALDPRRHALVLVLGAVGKTVYASALLRMVSSGSGGPVAILAAIGDLGFALAFAGFLTRDHFATRRARPTRLGAT